MNLSGAALLGPDVGGIVHLLVGDFLDKEAFVTDLEKGRV